MIDPRAPFPLTSATVAVRGALSGPDADPYEIAGLCKIASSALALGLQTAGWNASRLPVEVDGLDHEVALAEGWVLDSTAEQFGEAPGPVVAPLADLPKSDYRLVPLLDWRYEPTESALIRQLAARLISTEEVSALLEATGLSDLADAVWRLDEVLTAERLAEVTR